VGSRDCSNRRSRDPGFGCDIRRAYAVGGSGATEDNWVGFLGAVSLLGGLVASLAAFALALAAKIKHEKWALLWLPFLLFPALLAFLVLGTVLVGVGTGRRRSKTTSLSRRK
jgi:hypothetical protein